MKKKTRYSQIVNKVCSKCGSEDILKDAYAVWNKELQDWVLLEVYDYTFCNNCDGETNVKTVKLE